MKMVAISPNCIDKAWPELSTGIDEVLKLGLIGLTEQDVFENVRDGQWLMFTVFDEGQPVVSLVAVIRGKLFDVGLCWGSRVNEWIKDVHQMFEVVGRELGCEMIAFNGRPGWRKLAKERGFKVKTVTYMKDIL